MKRTKHHRTGLSVCCIMCSITLCSIIIINGSRISLRVGAPTPKVGVVTYFIKIFGCKLHENERPRGSLAFPLGSANDYGYNTFLGG